MMKLPFVFIFFSVLAIKCTAQLNSIEIEYSFNVGSPSEGKLTFYKVLIDNGKQSIFSNKDTAVIGSGLIIPIDKTKNHGLYIDKIENKSYQYEPIYGKDFYIVDDSISDKFKWTILDTGSKIILGYNCKMASCNFRGRLYYAFYSEELPYNTGPWKLTGLPGTILEAFTKDGKFEFTAYKITNNLKYDIISNPYVEKAEKFISFVDHKRLLRKKMHDYQQKLQSEVKSGDDITYEIKDDSIELLEEQ